MALCIEVSPALIQGRDTIDLYTDSSKDIAGLNGSSCWWILFKVGLIDFIHSGKVVDVLEEHTALDRSVQR